MRLDSMREYLMAKNMANWGAPVAPFHTSWERLGDRLEERFGQHIWHPDNYKESPDDIR